MPALSAPFFGRTSNIDDPRRAARDGADPSGFSEAFSSPSDRVGLTNFPRALPFARTRDNAAAPFSLKNALRQGRPNCERNTFARFFGTVASPGLAESFRESLLSRFINLCCRCYEILIILWEISRSKRSLCGGSMKEVVNYGNILGNFGFAGDLRQGRL